MNEDPLDTLQSMKSVRLSDFEKATMRNKLVAYMDEHPLEDLPFRSWTFGKLVNVIQKPVAVGLVAAVFFVAVTGWAAAKSLPGDVLYPLKVNVGEEVVGLLAVTPKAKVEWETKRATERLKEAEQLVATGNLDEEKRGVIEQNLKKHTEQAQKHLAQMEKEEDFDNEAVVASKLETNLKAHSQILQEVAKASSTPRTSTLLETIKDAGTKASSIRAEAEGKASNDPKNDTQSSAEGKMKAAESKIKEARKNLEGIDPESKPQNKLDLAQSLYDRGKAKYESGSYNESFALFQQALRTAQEASIIAQVQKETKAKTGRGDKNVKGVSTSTQDTEKPVTPQGDQKGELPNIKKTDKLNQEKDSNGTSNRGRDHGRQD